MDYYIAHGRNARRTCRHFDISPQTFYRWWRRYQPQDLTTLEAHSRRPRRRRQPTWSPTLAAAVRALRQQYPRCGKNKLVILFHRAGWTVLALRRRSSPPRRAS
jgi:transposase-like protein